ncbi:MAG: hypothetical protein JOZ73_00125, partial [Solirubrobacterales bacterium]|nr:hypothetical protein [Solirubrobacterales bacterium]
PLTTARGVASVALAPDQGCDATAVITLDNADFLQTLLLLEVGALIPLGLTLILLPWQTRYEDSFKKPASLTK